MHRQWLALHAFRRQANSQRHRIEPAWSNSVPAGRYRRRYRPTRSRLARRRPHRQRALGGAFQALARATSSPEQRLRPPSRLQRCSASRGHSWSFPGWRGRARWAADQRPRFPEARVRQVRPQSCRARSSTPLADLYQPSPWRALRAAPSCSAPVPWPIRGRLRCLRSIVRVRCRRHRGRWDRCRRARCGLWRSLGPAFRR